jgi:phosphohistidine phosphatase
MVKELWVMRHGKAQRFDGIEDYDRTLRKRGKRAAKLVGKWLVKNALSPDRIISSPAVRAFVTARIVGAQFNIDSDAILRDKRLYDEGLVRLRAALADCPENCEKLLVVGHNPELESLLIYLLDSDQLPQTDKLLPTAALVRLKISGTWAQLKPKSAELLEYICPKNLLESENASEE